MEPLPVREDATHIRNGMLHIQEYHSPGSKVLTNGMIVIMYNTAALRQAFS